MIASALVLLSVATVGAGPGGVVVGLVVGPDGRPAAGAEVIAAGGSWDDEAPAPLGRTSADAEGRFSLRLEADPEGRDRPTVWAYRPGFVAASAPIDRDAAAGSPVRLALGAPAHAGFTVAGPERRPVAGARIIPRRLARGDLDVPEALGRLAGPTTDGEGRAVVTAFRPEELVGVRVESAGYGVQLRDFRGRDGQADVGDKPVELTATGRVVGRVVAEDPKAVAGLTVHVGSTAGGRPIGVAGAITDGSGRFEVPAIAAGDLTIRARPRAGSPDLPGRLARRSLAPGGSAEVEIPLRRGVRVFGSARDGRDGRPVAGVVVAVLPSGPAEPLRLLTDADGRYESYVPAGTATHRVLKVPAPYLPPPDFLGPRPVDVPAAIAGLELPAIVLTRGVDVRGTVVDEDDRPAPGARVEASWTLFDGRSRVPRSATASARPDGSFDLGPVDPEAELAMVARSGAGATASPVAVRASDGRPARLTVVGPDDVAPVGRVVDPEGRPIAGASVRIWSTGRSASGPAEAGSLVHFDGKDELKTDARGRFRGDRLLRRDRTYRAMAAADGHLHDRTPPARPGPADFLTFPDLVLHREPCRMAVEGRVVDRRGRPVAGASVRTSADGPCSPRATADPAGRFRIEGVPEGRCFLFAEAEGFRFDGRAIDPAGGPFELILTRGDEAPSTSMTTRPIAPPPPGLARRVLAPYADRVLSDGDHASRVRTLELLARVDPARVLELIRSGGVEDPGFADHLRAVAGVKMLASGVDAAMAIVEGIGDGEFRVLGYLDAAAALPATARALRGDWTERALRDARAISNPSGRVVALARVAGRMLDLDMPDRARRLLDEARPLAESMAGATSGGRARGAFAECLARVDPANALAMTEDLVDPGAFDRCRLRIARSVARRDPAMAGRALASLRDPRSMARALPALCHALAPVDPDLALRLIEHAGGDDPCLPPYALGMMALAVSDTDKPRATAWLREAFDRLSDLADAGPSPPGAPHDPADVAAALLPAAERVDPGLVPELFWRAVSLHAPRPVPDDRSEAVLALLLARYDRPVALAIFGPLTARALEAPESDLRPLIAAAAVLDPALALRIIDELPEAPDLTFHRPRNVARLALADALARGAPACWDDALGHFLHLWTADAPDIE